MSGQFGSIVNENRVHRRRLEPLSLVAQPEPCFVCALETAIGSPLFSARTGLTRSNGVRTFICSPCLDRLSSSPQKIPESETLIEAVVAGLPNVIL
jgi:uncharacterized protein YlaI